MPSTEGIVFCQLNRKIVSIHYLPDGSPICVGQQGANVCQEDEDNFSVLWPPGLQTDLDIRNAPPLETPDR